MLFKKLLDDNENTIFHISVIKSFIQLIDIDKFGKITCRNKKITNRVYLLGGFICLFSLFGMVSAGIALSIFALDFIFHFKYTLHMMRFLFWSELSFFFLASIFYRIAYKYCIMYRYLSDLPYDTGMEKMGGYSKRKEKWITFFINHGYKLAMRDLKKLPYKSN